MNNSDYVIIGKLGTTYGVHGWLKVHSYTDVDSHILDYSPWYIEDAEKGFKLLTLTGEREHGKSVIVKIEGIDSPEVARLLTGKNIAVLRAQLPVLGKDEYYWRDLIGLSVIDQHGQSLGQVSYLIETGSNDVLVVKGEKEHAIPFLLNDVITRIDLNNKTIYVNWDIL
jgi:16S rRNA processing protein RimM